MSMGAKAPTPTPAPPPPPPAAPVPDAPIVGEGSSSKRDSKVKRTGTSSLRTDLMIVPGAATLGTTSLNVGA